MEEKKNAKVVKLDTTKKEDVKPEGKKATYEELNNYCMQLFQQNRQLVEKLRERDMENLFKRLDYLFLILRNKECFDAEFLGNCIDEIKTALTPPEEKAADDENVKE